MHQFQAVKFNLVLVGRNHVRPLPGTDRLGQRYLTEEVLVLVVEVKEIVVIDGIRNDPQAALDPPA